MRSTACKRHCSEYNNHPLRNLANIHQDSLQFLKRNYTKFQMNCAYLAEGKVSGNLVKNCDGLGSYDFCSVYKENNGNSKHHMRRKFLAMT